MDRLSSQKDSPQSGAANVIHALKIHHHSPAFGVDALLARFLEFRRRNGIQAPGNTEDYSVAGMGRCNRHCAFS
jgi:hypothetical protein